MNREPKDDRTKGEAPSLNKRAGSLALNRRGFLSASAVAAAGALSSGTPAGAESGKTASETGQVPASPGSQAKAPHVAPNKNLGSERDQRIDPKTGIKVIQLTSYPLPHAHFLYDWPSVTPDNQRVVFFGQRYASREAPWDLFRCDTDGLGLIQLTKRTEEASKDGYYGCPTAILALDGKTIYVVWNRVLCAVDVETGKTEDLLDLSKVCPEGGFNRAAFASNGDLFLAHLSPVPGAARVILSTGQVEWVETQGHLMGCFQKEPRLLVQRGEVLWGTAAGPDGTRIIVNQGEELGLWSTDEKGGDARFFCPAMFAHMTLLGRETVLQGCGKRPHTCIWLAEENREPRKLVEGPYFWHSGASYDGEWILADTNNPDEGLQLVHVPSARFKALCFAEATQDHFHFGHPHPALSQDGRIGVFRSDRRHVPHIYVAHITEEFRESVKAGGAGKEG